jgi:hypothetical protein
MGELLSSPEAWISLATLAAMAFSFAVELLNMRVRRARSAPVALHHRFEADAPPPGAPPG